MGLTWRAACIYGVDVKATGQGSNKVNQRMQRIINEMHDMGWSGDADGWADAYAQRESADDGRDIIADASRQLEQMRTREGQD